MNNELSNYHELNLKSLSQMKDFQENAGSAFLKNEVSKELEKHSQLFGLLYLIDLLRELKVKKERGLDNYFKGNFYKRKTPFLIGIAGAVSVGKTTFAKQLADNLHQINPDQRIEVVSSDNFLYSNAYLSEHNLLEQKGFPASFDNKAMWDFLIQAASFNEIQEIPIYDHQIYDIKNEKRRIRSADYIIVEGVNILEQNPLNKRLFCEMLDLTIYLEAKQSDIIDWFLKRINVLLDNADAGSFYEEYSKIDRKEAEKLALAAYDSINQPNFERYIEPSRVMAQLIIKFDSEHLIDKIFMMNY